MNEETTRRAAAASVASSTAREPRWWFVHIDEPYYPSGQVVEAVDVEDAIRKAWKESGEGPGYREDRVAFAVFPLEAGEFAGEADRVWSLVRGEYSGHYEGEPADVPTRPLPEGILPPVDPVQKAFFSKRMSAMATFAVIPRIDQHPSGWNPDPRGEHDRPEDGK